MTIKDMKQNVRYHVELQRSALAPSEHQCKSERICEQLWEQYILQLTKGNSNPTFLTYMPFRSEIDVTPLMEKCWSHGIRVAVPRAIVDKRQLRLHFIETYEDVIAGAYGIREPRADAPEWTDPISKADMVLVPGMAFDEMGSRLGYGGGYYDRLLDRWNSRDQFPQRPLLVAAAFELQIVPSVPIEPHDLRMDVIVTEKRIIARK